MAESHISRSWSKRDIKSVVASQMKANSFDDDEKIKCLIVILQNYAFGILNSFYSVGQDMKSSVWKSGLRDIHQWKPEHMAYEVDALIKDYPEINDLYLYSINLFQEDLRIQIKRTCSLMDFIKSFVQVLMKRPDVKSRAALKYGLGDRKIVARDALRITLLRLFKDKPSDIGSKRNRRNRSYISSHVPSTVKETLMNRSVVATDSVSQICKNESPKNGTGATLVIDDNGKDRLSQLSYSIDTKLGELNKPKDVSPKEKPCFWERGTIPDLHTESVIPSVRSSRW